MGVGLAGGGDPKFCSEAAQEVRSQGKSREKIGEQLAWNVQLDRGP